MARIERVGETIDLLGEGSLRGVAETGRRAGPAGPCAGRDREDGIPDRNR